MALVNFTQFRKNLATHLDAVVDDHAEFIVTRQNKEPVVVVSLADWQAMNETSYLLSNPANREHLLALIAELDAGRGEEHELIEP